MRQEHIFKPVWDRESKILILGTFPSVASRQSGFYYGIRRTGSGM
jgi:G:T/U-mismatch repair DNA glycosylase